MELKLKLNRKSELNWKGNLIKIGIGIEIELKLNRKSELNWNRNVIGMGTLN